jgi:hypothetical protein
MSRPQSPLLHPQDSTTTLSQLLKATLTIVNRISEENATMSPVLPSQPAEIQDIDISEMELEEGYLDRSFGPSLAIQGLHLQLNREVDVSTGKILEYERRTREQIKQLRETSDEELRLEVERELHEGERLLREQAWNLPKRPQAINLLSTASQCRSTIDSLVLDVFSRRRNDDFRDATAELAELQRNAEVQRKLQEQTSSDLTRYRDLFKAERSRAIELSDLGRQWKELFQRADVESTDFKAQAKAIEESLSEQSKALKADFERAQKQIETLTEDVRTLNLKSYELSDRLSTAVQDSKKAKSQVRALKEQALFSESSIEHLTAEVLRLQDETQSNEKFLDDNAVERDELKFTIKEHKNTIKSKDDEIERLTNDLEELKQKKSEAESKTPGWKTPFLQLQTDLEKANRQEDLAAKDPKLETSPRRESESFKDRDQLAKDGYEKRYVALEAQLVASRRECNRIEQERDNFAQANKEATEAYVDAQRLIEALETTKMLYEGYTASEEVRNQRLEAKLRFYQEAKYLEDLADKDLKYLAAEPEKEKDGSHGEFVRSEEQTQRDSAQADDDLYSAQY